MQLIPPNRKFSLAILVRPWVPQYRRGEPKWARRHFRWHVDIQIFCYFVEISVNSIEVSTKLWLPCRQKCRMASKGLIILMSHDVDKQSLSLWWSPLPIRLWAASLMTHSFPTWWAPIWLCLTSVLFQLEFPTITGVRLGGVHQPLTWIKNETSTEEGAWRSTSTLTEFKDEKFPTFCFPSVISSCQCGGASPSALFRWCFIFFIHMSSWWWYAMQHSLFPFDKGDRW